MKLLSGSLSDWKSLNFVVWEKAKAAECVDQDHAALYTFRKVNSWFATEDIEDNRLVIFYMKKSHEDALLGVEKTSAQHKFFLTPYDASE